LYFYLPWCSVRLLGPNEFALRLPSLAAGVALTAATYGLARRWTGSYIAACLAAVLVATDPNCLFYSLEARPYACVQLLGVWHMFLCVRRIEYPTAGIRAAWIAVGVVLFYVHYTSALLFLAELAFWLTIRLRVADTEKASMVPLLADFALLLLGCLTAGEHLSEIAARRENWKIIVSAGSVWSIFRLFPLGSYVALPAGIVGLCWLFQDAPRGRSELKWGSGLAWLAAACWLLVPSTLAWLSTAMDWFPLFLRRYVIVSSIAPILLASLLTRTCPSRRVRALIAVIVVTVGAATTGPIAQLRDDGRLIRRGQEDWRLAITALNAALKADRSAAIFVRSGLIEADGLRVNDAPDFVDYCRFPLNGIYRIADGHSLPVPLPSTDSGNLSAGNWQQIKSAGRAFFLLRGSTQSVDVFIQQLQENAQRFGLRADIHDRRMFGRLALVQISSK
jgi:uncharacterized membrane protein